MFSQFPSIKFPLSNLSFRSYAHDSAQLEYVALFSFIKKTVPSIQRGSSNAHLTITCYYSECGGLVMEPLEELSFKGGDTITERECQWNIGDAYEPNGDHVILAIDPVFSCR